MTTFRRTAVAGAALLALLVPLACGDDDGGSVREIGAGGGSSSASGSASASGSGSASASASGSASTPASGSTTAACEPVGNGSGTAVPVTLDEWSVEPGAPSAPAGKVTFKTTNAGAEPHELVVVRAASAEALPLAEGKVTEDALPAGSFIGEIEAYPAGESCDGTFELTAGDYVLFCNIVEEEGGARESHFEQGMHAAFRVT